ncbi:glycosyltransferase [Marinicella sediminis]|uniref:Glycosyltransferase n=1 Tax=Marinicella sediminis TaxID=1792834 RepID=A0ABV7JFS3_9GAMM|nr:glycosyltransferase [Marinicella sediminis]
MNSIQNQLKKTLRQSQFNTSNGQYVVAQVTIVVPVYNGFDALKQCCLALLENTPHVHPVCFLNDASTDERVKPYLDQLTDKWPHLTVIHRPQNQGYLHNINQHMNDSPGNLLLLNADTRVTSGWLDELLEIASDSRVGAVCPLSDNATLLSLQNHHPKMDLSVFSGRWYPLPTAVGFCLLLKQQVLEELGGFDPYYHPGYGEECDYSMRIRQLGLQVASAPAAFVYHQGSASFSCQASTLQSRHQLLLDLRWPDYQAEVARFMAFNPASLIDAYLHNHRHPGKHLLHVVHGLENKGGVEQFTRQLLLRMDDSLIHSVLVPYQLSDALQQQFAQKRIHVIVHPMPKSLANHVVFNFPADPWHDLHDQRFVQLIAAGGYAGVHFHSLVGVGTMLWPLLCHQLDIPYWFFFHDHTGLCQIFSLSNTVDGQEVYCGKTHWQPDVLDCKRCIRQKTQKAALDTEDFMALRERLYQRIVEGAKKLYFPSVYLLNSYLKKYPAIKNRSQVLDPCFYPNHSQPLRAITQHPVKLAFLGQFGSLKGAGTFLQLCQLMGSRDFEWHVIGGIDPRYKQALKTLNIRCHGSYETSQLGELLSSIDLVIFTGQIPETYGITLTEAMLHGTPVIAPDVGALGQRVNPGVHGLLYPPGDLHALQNTIGKWVNENLPDHADRTIEYRDSQPDKVAVITANYHKHTPDKTTHNGQTLSATDRGYCLKPPANSAYQQMSEWLNAPRTLEAAADWQDAPEGLRCLILGSDSTARQQTRQWLSNQLKSPEFIQPAHVDSLDAQSPVLVIESGHKTNENLGNWVSCFARQSSLLSTADFALFDQQEQFYAPQFAGLYSWQNHLTRYEAIGCILARGSALKTCLSQSPKQTDWSVADCLRLTHQQQPGRISHFPYYSYAMPDTWWVNNWKTRSAQESNQSVSLSHWRKVYLQRKLKLRVVTECHRDPQQTKLWLDHLRQQTLLAQPWCELISLNALAENPYNPAAEDSGYTHVMYLRDNVRCRHPDCLEKLLISLLNTELDVVSMALAKDRHGDYLIANKQGGAPYFVSPGQIRDRRFDKPFQAWEHELIDDDCVVYKLQAWQQIRPLLNSKEMHYNALRCSLALQQGQMKAGVIEIKGLYKQGTPALDLSAPISSLGQQRQTLTELNQHRLPLSHYPAAFSTRRLAEPDHLITSFKTPKNLPRVVAFAHDHWASGFYRVTAPLTALAAANHISVHFLPIASQQHLPTPYELHRLQPDVLYIQHYYSDARLAALKQFKKQLNIRVVLDIDDLMTDIPDYNPFAEQSPDDMAERLRQAFSLADLVVTSTRFLANEYAHLHHDIRVIANRLSKNIWPMGPKYSHNPKPRIGWAGAGQHEADLQWLVPVIEQTRDVCQWVFFGDQPKGLTDTDIEFHPPVPLAEYPEQLQQLQLDMAIAPLVDNPFNQAKSQLKLIEYGALGLPVVASDLVAYQHSPAVCLPNEPTLWSKQIVEWANHQEARQKAGMNMKTWVDEHFWLEDHLTEWLAALGF